VSGLSVTVDDGEAQAMFRRLASVADNMAPALDAIGQLIASSVRGNIASGTDYTGSPFVGLSETTLDRRRKAGKDAKPLRDTGRLMNSITHRVNGDSVAVFTDVVYAAAQQFGNPGNRMFGKAAAPIPARPFFPIRAGHADLQPDVIADMMEIASRHIAKVLA